MAKISVKKRHTIRRSEIARLKTGLEEQIGEAALIFLTGQIEVVETGTGWKLYLVKKKNLLMASEAWVFPTLRGLIEHSIPCRQVVVDSGAVRFITNGADVMRPGIVSVSDDVRAGQPVQVVEERYGKPIAIAVALFDAVDMHNQEKGKSCKTIHFVGDDLWNLEV